MGIFETPSIRSIAIIIVKERHRKAGHLLLYSPYISLQGICLLLHRVSLQACRYGRVQHLEHLLFYGAELDVQNATGNTPLHVCAAYNQVNAGIAVLHIMK